ncbi:MAG: M23 family metallopeptidase [Spirochaetes bacterium]|nr:M23 family metallopeptidase [Spirochaetota bacterium]
MRHLLPCLLGASLWLLSLYGEEEIEFLKRKEGDQLVLSVSNGAYLPMQVRLSGALAGYESDHPFPILATLPPRSVPDLARLTPAKGATRLSMKVSLEAWPGDPGRVPDTNVTYLFPWAHGVRHAVGQGYGGAFSHQGLKALDFDLAEGEAIHAARGGIVVRILSNFTRGGLDPALISQGNILDVLHDDGTVAHYDHLRAHGTVRRLGEHVAAGDLLAYCGHTGYGSGAHLHFEVTRARAAEKPLAIPTFFAGPGGQRLVAEEGLWYTALHPGKPPVKAPPPIETLFREWSALTNAVARTGSVQLRGEQREDRFLLYIQNGYDRQITLKITLESKNLGPLTEAGNPVLCPALCETLFGVYRVLRAGEKIRYGMSYELLP